jgi:hypothetical protein
LLFQQQSSVASPHSFAQHTGTGDAAADYNHIPVEGLTLTHIS